MSDSPPQVITVEIYGQQYPIKSSLDAAYVVELAAFVDQRMHAAAGETPSGESLKIAVLAALNIADEFFRCRHERIEGTEWRERAEAIESLLDRALANSP
ncbi:MAG: cell division protein ZapA [Acidobacteria bacterium]|nr:cell division protein ZapA [Acidobacteriota bacterium]